MKEEYNIYMSTALGKFLDQNPTYKNDKNLNNQLHYMAYLVHIQHLEGIKIDPERTMLAEMYFVDEMIKNLPKSTTKDFSCHKGCSACCRINVDISNLEAKVIIKYCKENKIPIDEKYLKEQTKIEGNKIGQSDKYNNCVFLKDNECSIYPVRPIQCRKYHVYNEPQYCDVIKHPGHICRVHIDIDIECFISGIIDLVNNPIDRMPIMLLDNL